MVTPPGSAPRQSAASQWSYPPAQQPVSGLAPTPAERAGHGPQSMPPANHTGVIDQMWSEGQRRGNGLLITVAAVAAGVIGIVVVVAVVMNRFGAAPTFTGFIVALFPLTVVLAGVAWLDRWEPEPKAILALAFLWGGGVATAAALGINTWAQQAIYDATGDAQGAVTTGSVIVAPIVEESLKGLGVLVIYLWRRRNFDGPVDGVVYGATVAAGFAFTENILYFAQGSTSGMLAGTFIGRAVMSPFAHAMFTACTGLAIGLAARARRSTVIVFAFPVGLAVAMGLHSLWNGTASMDSFGYLYLVVQVPLFLSLIGLMWWLRRQEAGVISARLTEYGQAGWYAPHEVVMLSSLRLRSQARAWAAGYGPEAKAAMSDFQRDSTQLAYLRQRHLSGRADLKADRSEHELLKAITSDRAAFTTAAARALGRRTGV